MFPLQGQPQAVSDFEACQASPLRPPLAANGVHACSCSHTHDQTTLHPFSSDQQSIQSFENTPASIKKLSSIRRRVLAGSNDTSGTRLFTLMPFHYATSTLLNIHSLPTEVALATMFLPPTPLQLRPTIVENPTMLSTVLSSAITVATAITNSSSPDSRAGAENGECRLLGPFALFIQGALGVLALLSLVYKRWRERPQRPIKIWAFDASKQVVGSALLHVANLLMSMFSSGQITPKAGDYEANPCSFYLLNLAIDVSRYNMPLKIRNQDNNANLARIDNHWDPHTDRPPAPSTLWLCPHPSCQPPRINPVWSLRSSTTSIVVAQTVLHILPWPIRHEILRFPYLSAMSMDCHSR